MGFIIMFLLATWYPANLVAAQALQGEKSQLEFTGSEAHGTLRHMGYEVVKEQEAAFEGKQGGVLVVARSERGLALFAYARQKSGFELLGRSVDLPGEELSALKTMALGDREGILFKVLEDSPDEAIFNEILFLKNPSGIFRVLTARWVVRHSEQEAGRQAVEVMDLGAFPMGLSFEPGKRADSWPTAILRSNPKVLELNCANGKKTWLTIGSRVRVFLKDGLGFRQSFEGFQDYLYSLGSISMVTGGGSDTAEIRVKGKPGTDMAAEQLGQKINLHWTDPVPIRAVSIQRCERAGGGLKTFDLSFSPDLKIPLDLTKHGKVDQRLLGVGEFKSGHDDIQTMIFLRNPVYARTMSIDLGPCYGKAGDCCLAKLVVLTSLVDKKRAHKGP